MSTLAGLLPETAAAYAQLAAYASKYLGADIAVADYGGIRTQADTTRILKYRQDDFAAAVNAGQIRADTTLQAFRPINAFGTSYHNYGAAFDITINGEQVDQSPAAIQALGTFAPSVGLRWGGTFRNPDRPHFELAIPLKEAQSRYLAMTGGTVRNVNAGDLSKFLPSLTPTTDDYTESYDMPDLTDVYPDVTGAVAGDDSGADAIAVEMGSDNNTNTMMVFGLVIVGVMAWAIRRKFS